MIGDEPRFVLDGSELLRQGPSYTIDTIRHLRSDQPGQCLFLIIGQDQYARLHTWHAWRELLDLVQLAVAARAGEAVKTPQALLGVEHEVVRLEMPAMDVSSTAVRAACARGDDVRPMVGEAVAGYIALHRLYEQQTDTQATTP
jgi:nicotinate-nucleotide adenylyltransferase